LPADRSPRIFATLNPGYARYLDDGETLFTFDELDVMVRETYQLWREVCEERTAETRRRGTGTGGSGDDFL